ncbi:MAG TPA: glycerophosphoryl diester phosphodiesterase membrane domain-containing protein [Sphingomonas sp.]|nr:glycerophosphoryl diester phosphodiesterase membrane domain-containing protein [Sphingomonas sp.]
MKPLSIEDAYLWAQRFVAREWKLILPVALAFMALPPLMLDLLIPQSAWAMLTTATQTKNAAAAMSTLAWLVPLQLIVLLFATAGGLAITALALQPAISVGEALALALRRLGVLIGAVLLLLAGALLLALAVGMIAASARLGPAIIQSLLTGALAGIALFIGARLIPLVPLIVRRRVGPVSAIRESWLMTEGASWRIFAAIVIYFIGAMVVMLALSTGVGAILLLIGKAAGLPELGLVLVAVFERSLAALIGAGSSLLAAGLFRQLDNGTRGT